ncbi:MAG: hypothetical protein ACTSQY_10620 [Candidatus Odinarchaeia archaeon]
MRKISGRQLPLKPLEYTSYLIIKKFKELTGHNPTGLYFNKVISLCYRELKEDGIDIALPHYWYRYGDQVLKQGMPYNIKWNHESPVKTEVKWSDEEYPLVSDRTYEKIESIVTKLTEKYANNIQGAIREVYAYAPFDFQRAFLELREIFYGWKYAFDWDQEIYERMSINDIIKTFKKFPVQDFPALKKNYQIVYKLIELSVGSEAWSFKLIQELCTQFWFLFCYHLRLKAHENIPKNILDKWRANIGFQNYKYRKIIADILIKFAEKHPKILEDKLLKKEYNWRINDLKEAEKVINEYLNNPQKCS